MPTYVQIALNSSHHTCVYLRILAHDVKRVHIHTHYCCTALECSSAMYRTVTLQQLQPSIKCQHATVSYGQAQHRWRQAHTQLRVAWRVTHSCTSRLKFIKIGCIWAATDCGHIGWSLLVNGAPVDAFEEGVLLEITYSRLSEPLFTRADQVL